MRPLLLISLAVLSGCAQSAAREEPDPAAIESASAAASSGDVERAAALADSATDDCGRGEAAFPCAVTTRLFLARQFASLGHPELALMQARSATQLAEQYGDEWSQFTAFAGLATFAARAGEIGEARNALSRARSLLSSLETQESPEESLRPARAALHGPEALIYFAEGEPSRAAESQAELVAYLRELDSRHPSLPVELLNLADMYQAAGRTEEAAAALMDAAAVAAEIGDTASEEEALSALSSLSMP